MYNDLCNKCLLERYGIKGNLLQWLGRYISAREQQVIIKNAISGKGNLKAGVPQGSILGPLLFLVSINDIADETIGLCRLFADDTSIGEKSYEMNSLCNMVNTDFKNISEWSKQWLVKLNPTKTDIVYFNTRDIPPGLFFWIEKLEFIR